MLVMEGIVMPAVAGSTMRIWCTCIALSKTSTLIHDGSSLQLRDAKVGQIAPSVVK